MLPSDILNKRILLSPLNWGMGHVSRCIPLVDLFLRNGNVVFIACDESQRAIFEDYFPELSFIHHLGYPFKFGKQGNFGLDLAKQFRQLNSRLADEEVEVNQYVDEFEIDILISDHRYGFKSEKVHSILLTHQLQLPVRWYEKWVQKIHFSYLKQFDEIWVPDNENSQFAGQLSCNTQAFKVSYIGLLSRFTLYKKVVKDLDLVVIISGPGVYAEQFLEEILKSQTKSANVKVVICSDELIPNENVTGFTFISSKDWSDADSYILRAKKIISRAGYSTLMDVIELNVPYEISATPGQREQEYLKELWDEFIEQ